jgi:hypothetical protein
MNPRAFATVGFLGAAALMAACGVSSEPNESNAALLAPATLEQQRLPTRSELLNFSHAECNEDGSVNVHFVLLFHGASPPGTLVVETNQGELTTTAYKSSGNVWHYNLTMAASEIILESGYVDGTPLHNPGDIGDFSYCLAPPPPPVCSVTVTPGPVCAKPNEVFGSSGKVGIPDPQRECEWLGLALIGKDDGSFSGSTAYASMDAYVAIVKGGNGGGDVCEAGGGSIYNVYSPVTEGELLWTGNKTGVSHITYCRCPDIAE